MEMKPLETHRRSVVKSVSYRVSSIVADSLVAYFFTRSVAISAGIVILVNAYSTILYYLHERAWARVRWGRQRVAD